MVVPIASLFYTCTLSLGPRSVWWTMKYNYLKPFFAASVLLYCISLFGPEDNSHVHHSKVFPKGQGTLHDLVGLIGSHYWRWKLVVLDDFFCQVFLFYDGKENPHRCFWKIQGFRQWLLEASVFSKLYQHASIAQVTAHVSPQMQELPVRQNQL